MERTYSVVSGPSPDTKALSGVAPDRTVEKSISGR